MDLNHIKLFFNVLNSKINSYDILWTGDVHEIGQYMNLLHPYSDYKRIVFVFNVVPSRTPEYDVPADQTWYPEIQTDDHWDVTCYPVSIRLLTIELVNSTQFKSVAYFRTDEYFTPGLVKIIGFKSY